MPSISQAYIHGSSSHSTIAAVLVVLQTTTVPSVAQIREFLIGSNLKSSHSPASLIVVHDAFAVSNGLLTSSSKLCRPALRKEYGDELKVKMAEAEVDISSQDDRVANEVLELAIQAGKGGLATPAQEEQWAEYVQNISSITAIQIQSQVTCKADSFTLPANTHSLYILMTKDSQFRCVPDIYSQLITSSSSDDLSLLLSCKP